MKRVLIKTFAPINEKGERPIDFRFTTSRRKCGDSDPPKLYCNDV